MEHVSVDDVKSIVTDHDIKRFSFKTCKTCHHPYHYYFEGNDVSISNCCVGECGGTRPSSYGGVATSFNRLDPKDRAVMWERFLCAGDTTDVVMIDKQRPRTTITAETTSLNFQND